MNLVSSDAGNHVAAAASGVQNTGGVSSVPATGSIVMSVSNGAMRSTVLSLGGFGMSSVDLMAVV